MARAPQPSVRCQEAAILQWIAALLAACALLGACAAFAQALEAAPRAAAGPESGKDIVVTRSTCVVDGTNAGERRLAFDCLNEKLAPDPRARAAPHLDLEARYGAAPPSQTGTFSFTATHQRMGANFGRAAQGFRPPQPTFSNPPPR